MNRVRNKVLRAVDDPAAIFLYGRRARAGCVRTCPWFSQTPCAQLIASGKRHEILLFLRIRAILKNVIRTKRSMRGNRNSNRTIDAGEFFDNRCVLHVT